jgi:hypothetical protein
MSKLYATTRFVWLLLLIATLNKFGISFVSSKIEIVSYPILRNIKGLLFSQDTDKQNHEKLGCTEKG